MRNESSYVMTEFVEKYPDLMINVKPHVMGMHKGSVKAIQFVGILKIVFALYRGKLRFSQLYTNSCIKAKQSFCLYLNYCVKHKLIEKRMIKNKKTYSLTDDGRYFLRIFEKKDDV